MSEHPPPAISISHPSPSAPLTATSSRPSFQPTLHHLNHPSSLATPNEPWVEAISAPCHFSLPIFLSTLKDLCLHPERNSSLILRADYLVPLTDVEEEGKMDRLERLEEIKVRLMPKQPKRDGRLDQRCIFYRTSETNHEQAIGVQEGIVLMIPQAKEIGDIPFYHPPVRKLAFRYESISMSSDTAMKTQNEADGELPVTGRLSISYIPFDTTDPSPSTGESLTHLTSLPMGAPLGRPAQAPRKRSPLAAPPLGVGSDPKVRTPPPAFMLAQDGTIPETGARPDTAVVEERLHRTLLALLERVHKHGYGTMMGYQKRVMHDIIVPRDSFQDLYLALKDRHRHLDSRALKAGSSKIEDVKRHVFKDVAIAAFLMLLWRNMYPAREMDNAEEEKKDWDSWGRPQGGFVDLGCGNGLLVHILIAEGYRGRGFELRSRRTWPLYPPSTRAALIEMPIDFPSWFPTSLESWTSGSWTGLDTCPVKEGTFLIGNHADEISPWIPLLSLIPHTPVPHLSLPCCLHTLDGSFDRLQYIPPAHPHTPLGGFENGLEPGQSRYKAYLMWLGWCGLQCGWEWEKEGLRVPSTKGWGIIARSRWAKTPEEHMACRQWALEQIIKVRAQGSFKVREKEGKEHSI